MTTHEEMVRGLLEFLRENKPQLFKQELKRMGYALVQKEIIEHLQLCITRGTPIEDILGYYLRRYPDVEYADYLQGTQWARIVEKEQEE
jgi:hypothetical protein